MSLQSDYRKHAFPTRVLTLDGQEIATGPSKLEADGKEGWFEPDSVSLTSHALDASTYPELLLKPEKLPAFRVLNFRRLVDSAGQPSGITPGPFGELVVNQRFYFQVVQTCREV